MDDKIHVIINNNTEKSTKQESPFNMNDQCIDLDIFTEKYNI